MGEPMARSLRSRRLLSVTACAYATSRSHRSLAVRKIGVVEAADPAAVGRAVDIAFVCVPGRSAGRGSAVRRARPRERLTRRRDRGRLLDDFADRLHARLSCALDGHSGIHFVGCAGQRRTRPRAETGTLTIMVRCGGRGPALGIQPLLATMGTPHHVGGHSAWAETVKLVNQVVIANVMIANAEALTFAQRGREPTWARFEKFLNRRRVPTTFSNNGCPRRGLPERSRAGSRSISLRKDLSAALEAARAVKHSMPATALAYQLYTARSAEGDGALDYSAIAKSYERIADRENGT